MMTGCYETSLLLFANARGPGTLLIVKCPALGTHHETNAWGLPGGVGGGGMLMVGFDFYISTVFVLFYEFQISQIIFFIYAMGNEL